MQKCRENIFGDYRFHKCSRNAGFGPNGEYCKQHAKKYDPLPEATGSVIYRVKETYMGKVVLVSTPTVKETPQFYMIPKEAEKEWNYSSRVKKAIAFLSKEIAVNDFIRHF